GLSMRSGPGGVIVERHVLDVELGLQPADRVRPADDLLRRELVDAGMIEGDGEERFLQVRREKLERAALFRVVAVVALDDEVLVPLEPTLGMGLGESDAEVGDLEV